MTTRLDLAIEQLREAFADEVESQYETRMDRHLSEVFDSFYGVDITSAGVAFRELHESAGPFTVTEALIATVVDVPERYFTFTEAVGSMLPGDLDAVVEERISRLVQNGGILHLWDDQVSWFDGQRNRSTFRNKDRKSVV